MSQLEFDFSDVTEITLEDRDGDRFTFDRYADRISAVRYFLKCTKSRAAQVLEDLEKEWDVYSEMASALGGKQEMFFNKNKNKYQELHLEQAIKTTKMERGMDIK